MRTSGPDATRADRIAQTVGDSTSEYARAFARLDVRVAIPNNETLAGQNSKPVKHVVDQSGMRFFLRRAVAAQNRIELLLDTQTAQYGNR